MHLRDCTISALPRPFLLPFLSISLYLFRVYPKKRGLFFEEKTIIDITLLFEEKTM